MMVRPEEDELYVVMDFVDTDLHKVIQSKQVGVNYSIRL